MCTDLSLNALEIIRLYGLRFNIEHSFKQAMRVIGAFAYHFWMLDMTPLRYRNGNQDLHRKSAYYRHQVKRKIQYLEYIFMWSRRSIPRFWTVISARRTPDKYALIRATEGMRASPAWVSRDGPVRARYQHAAGRSPGHRASFAGCGDVSSGRGHASMTEIIADDGQVGAGLQYLNRSDATTQPTDRSR
jgi:hypothetical protein